MSEKTYKKAEEDDARCRVFCKVGTIFINKINIAVRILNSQTRCCIVAHKALAQFEDMSEELRDQDVYVLIYKFRGMNGNVGVTLIQSSINPSNHQIFFHSSYKDTKKNFIELMKTAAKTTDRNIIYYGARNEG